MSQYCLQNLHCPTICVKHERAYISPQTEPVSPTSSGMAEARPQICLAVDNTEHSHKMLVWAAHHLIGQGDNIHLISVAHGSHPSGSDLTLQATAMDPAPVLPCTTDSTEGTQGYLLIREAHRAIQKAVEILESQKVNGRLCFPSALSFAAVRSSPRGRERERALRWCRSNQSPKAPP